MCCVLVAVVTTFLWRPVVNRHDDRLTGRSGSSDSDQTQTRGLGDDDGWRTGDTQVHAGTPGPGFTENLLRSPD